MRRAESINYVLELNFLAGYIKGIDFYIIKLFLIHLVQKFAVFEFNWKRC